MLYGLNGIHCSAIDTKLNGYWLVTWELQEEFEDTKSVSVYRRRTDNAMAKYNNINLVTPIATDRHWEKNIIGDRRERDHDHDGKKKEKNPYWSMTITVHSQIEVFKRCSVRLNFHLFCREFMFYLCYMYLFT